MIGYFAIASTGCSCCRSDNRAFGPYKTEEEAKERCDHNRATTTWASQFSKAGNHSVIERDIEELPDGRLIVGGMWVRVSGWAGVFHEDDNWQHPDDI